MPNCQRIPPSQQHCRHASLHSTAWFSSLRDKCQWGKVVLQLRGPRQEAVEGGDEMQLLDKQMETLTEYLDRDKSWLACPSCYIMPSMS